MVIFKIFNIFFIIYLIFSCRGYNTSSKVDIANIKTKDVDLIINVEEKDNISLTRSILNTRVVNIISFYIYGVKFKVDQKGDITFKTNESFDLKDYSLSNVIINDKVINNNSYYVQRFKLKYKLNFRNFNNYKKVKYFEIEKSGKDITLIFKSMLILGVKKLNKKNIEGVIIPIGNFKYNENEDSFILKENFFVYYRILKE